MVINTYEYHAILIRAIHSFWMSLLRFLFILTFVTRENRHFAAAQAVVFVTTIIRISLKRRDLFDKASGNIKWSEELFKINSINRSNLIIYKIKDLNDEIIEGIFYEKELQKTKNTSEVYVIEKIIRKSKNKYFVKWRGYSNDFNSWIDKDDIIKHT